MLEKINLTNSHIQSPKQGEKENDIRLEDISIMFTTKETEENRSTFDETFKEVPLDKTTDGKKFLEGLIDNKASLSQKLGLKSEEYDNLACIALALASQETGMGEEKGYSSENKGLRKLIRGFLKIFDDSSASSGLTQMKIHDFLNSDNKLTEREKEIIKSYGIESKGKSKNNLYKNPDKSAIATMVVLSSIANNYDNYKNILSSEHNRIGNEFISSGTNPDTAMQTGNNILNNIIDFYNDIPDADKQKEFRTVLKQFFLSQNGSKKSDKVEKDYNEEIQLNKLNEILKTNNAAFTLDIEDLNYIRYSLTDQGQEMSYNEYCAYGWNKGTGETGMQLDRLLADKIGTILKTPENFDYDQFTVNVNTLTAMYANQSYLQGEK